MITISKKQYMAALLTTIIMLGFTFSAIAADAVQPDASIDNQAGNSQDGPAKSDQSDNFDEFDDIDNSFENDIGTAAVVYDPLEPFNRAMFRFNDKFYYWLLKPTATGYRRVLPKGGRVAVSRFFSNLATPIRFVNCLLQLKFKSAGTELGRFVINSTIGIAGFMDPALKFHLYRKDEDFSQTLGFYGVGHGFYLNLPFLGPLTLRDLVGKIGDYGLDPVIYADFISPTGNVGLRTYSLVNGTSLNITLYDDLVNKAFDPYVFMKNAYFNIREKKVKE